MSAALALYPATICASVAHQGLALKDISTENVHLVDVFSNNNLISNNVNTHGISTVKAAAAVATAPTAK